MSNPLRENHHGRTALAFRAAIAICAATVIAAWNASSAQAYNSVLEGRTLERAADGSVTFALAPEYPAVRDQAAFEDGAHATKTREAFYRMLIERAMDRWNAVPGADVELRLAPRSTGRIDEVDGVHSLGVSSSLGVGVLGAALPVPTKRTEAHEEPSPDRGFIYDCDVQMNPDIERASEFVVVLTHEIGHCLGLGHNHANPKSIMSYNFDIEGDATLGLDDMAALIDLYPDSRNRTAGRKTALCGSVGAAGPAGAADAPLSPAPALLALFAPLIVVVASALSGLRRRAKARCD